MPRDPSVPLTSRRGFVGKEERFDCEGAGPFCEQCRDTGDLHPGSLTQGAHLGPLTVGRTRTTGGDSGLRIRPRISYHWGRPRRTSNYALCVTQAVSPRLCPSQSACPSGEQLRDEFKTRKLINAAWHAPPREEQVAVEGAIVQPTPCPIYPGPCCFAATIAVSPLATTDCPGLWERRPTVRNTG